MDRQEIIAALDAEIARLQHARHLIIQSRRAKQASRQSTVRPKQIKQKSEKLLVRKIEKIAELSHPAPQAAQKPEQQVAVVRVPARQPRNARRVAATPMRQVTALTRNVPQSPVAAPPKAREKKEGTERPTPSPVSTTAPASSFGMAISRGLASLS